MPPSLPPDTLHFPPSSRPFLDSYLPPQSDPTPASSSSSTTTTIKTEEQNVTETTYTSYNDTLHRPFTTLTFATSLDSALSLAPGVRTILSGPHSKAMTHYLRFRHEAILIGVGTANADDPGLNCRIEGAGGYEPSEREFHPERSHDKNHHTAGEEEQTRTRNQQDSLHQPRPIVIDPKARWNLNERSKILELVRQGKGKAPFVLISKTTTPPQKARDLLERYGGKYIALETTSTMKSDNHVKPDSDGDDDDRNECHEYFDWNAILSMLYKQEKISSLMIEGGGSIINSLLSEQRYSTLIDSVIVTIAPTWLGQGGVVVSPNRRVDENGCAIPASRLTDVKWYPFGEDVVLCGRILRS